MPKINPDLPDDDGFILYAVINKRAYTCGFTKEEFIKIHEDGWTESMARAIKRQIKQCRELSSVE